MIFCIYRKTRQHVSGLVDDQSHESCSNSNIKEVQGHMIRKQTCKNHLVKIQPVTKYQKYGHKSYGRIVTLRAPGHEDQQRAYEINDQVKIEDTLVGASVVKTVFEIDRFLGDVNFKVVDVFRGIHAPLALHEYATAQKQRNAYK